MFPNVFKTRKLGYFQPLTRSTWRPTVKMADSATSLLMRPSVRALRARLTNHMQGTQNLLWGEGRFSRCLSSSDVISPEKQMRCESGQHNGKESESTSSSYLPAPDDPWWETSCTQLCWRNDKWAHRTGWRIASEFAGSTWRPRPPHERDPPLTPPGGPATVRSQTDPTNGTQLRWHRNLDDRKTPWIRGWV